MSYYCPDIAKLKKIAISLLCFKFLLLYFEEFLPIKMLFRKALYFYLMFIIQKFFQQMLHQFQYMHTIKMVWKGCTPDWKYLSPYYSFLKISIRKSWSFWIIYVNPGSALLQSCRNFNYFNVFLIMFHPLYQFLSLYGDNNHFFYKISQKDVFKSNYTSWHAHDFMCG